MPRVVPPSPQPLAIEHLAEIAAGPTARVDLCRAHREGQPPRLVAVKRPRAEVADDPDVASRFLDEVWMTAALKHPNVVEVVGFGQDDRGSYLAMELVQGVSLARLRKTVFETGEDFPSRMVVFIAWCLCRGLAAAHALRSEAGEPLHLVHRDLTLDNVLVGFNGDVKIADFGLAKAKQRLTSTTVGLPAKPTLQMAPEEVSGKAVDHRVDLFSLGMLIFELLARRPPWIGTDELHTLAQIAHEPPADLAKLRPRLDPEIVAIVAGCLEKDPDARFRTADAVLERLDRWLVAHGYLQDNEEALARFVRRNAMRQMRWFEQAVRGAAASARAGPPSVPRYETKTGSGADPRAPRRSEATVVAGARERPSKSSTTVAVAQIQALGERTASRPAVIKDAETIEVLAEDEDEDWDAPTLVQKRTGAAPSAKRDPPAAAPPRKKATEGRGPRRPTPLPSTRTAVSTMSTRAMIAAEADRLRALAKQRIDEASALAEKAKRADDARKVASEAARLADEAARLANEGDLQEASRKLHRAHVLEASIESANERK